MTGQESVAAPADLCPRPDTWKAFNAGALDDDTARDLAGHLEGCPRCLAALLELSDADDLVRHLRRAAPPAPLLEEPACQRLRQRARAIVLPRPEGTPLPPEEDDPLLRAGQLGQYRLLGRLGRGGMGVVYRALHVSLDRPVAVKVLPGERAETGDLLRRFQRERKAIGRLHHAHIVQAFDAGEVDGVHYLVMELVDGPDLETAARRHKPLAVAAACEVVRQAARGLHHIHGHGLVHRDIKPSNLLLSREGVVKVSDLGLARHDAEHHGSQLTDTGVILGTVDYMAPEQGLLNQPLDARADVYSLGCVLYRLLAGRPPFAGGKYNTITNKLFGHAHDPVPPLDRHRDDVPAGLHQLVLRLLAKSPADRFATARDLETALEPFAAGADLTPLARGDGPVHVTDAPETVAPETSRPRAVPTDGPPVAPPRRRRWLVPALALGLLGVVAAVAALAILPPAQEPKLPDNIERVLKDKGGGDKGENPPVPVVRYFEDLRPEEVKPLTVYPLLNREPLKLVWPAKTTLATAFFQPDIKQLTVNCSNVGLLTLGVVHSNSYTFRMDLFQNRWKGGLGVFFGYRENMREGKTAASFQRIYLQAIGGKGKELFQLQRILNTGSKTASGEIVGSSGVLGGSEVFEQPLSRPQQLEITVIDGRLERVRFGGTECSGLCDWDINKRFQPDDYHGPFGIYAVRADGLFQNAAVQILDSQ